VPISQLSIPQNMPQQNPYIQQPAPTGQTEKRERKPLMIRDPVSNQPVEVPTLSTPATTTSTVFAITTITETRPTETTTDTNKTQIQTDFRHKMANLLITDTPTDKVYFRYSKQQEIY
jgi:hypothetical protein